jgi:hypothetical protein
VRPLLSILAMLLLLPGTAAAATVSAPPYKYTAAPGERNTLTITFDGSGGLTFADSVPITHQPTGPGDPEFPTPEQCAAVSANAVYCGPPRSVPTEPGAPPEVNRDPVPIAVTLGDGNDSLSFAGPPPAGYYATADGGAGNDTLSGFDNVTRSGKEVVDPYNASLGDGDVLNGGDGNDVLRGLRGADGLDGDGVDSRKPGSDVLDGGLGPDTVNAGIFQPRGAVTTTTEVITARDGYMDQIDNCNRGITGKLKLTADPLDYLPYSLTGPLGPLGRLRFCARGSTVADAGASQVPAVKLKAPRSVLVKRAARLTPPAKFTITCPASASGGCRGNFVPPVEFGESPVNSAPASLDLRAGESRTFTRKPAYHGDLVQYLNRHRKRATVTALATTRDGAGRSHTVTAKLTIRK